MARYIVLCSSKLKRITTLPTRAVGCIIVHLGQFLYLLGGEGRIGCGNWNMDVYRFDNLHKSWDVSIETLNLFVILVPLSVVD